MSDSRQVLWALACLASFLATLALVHGREAALAPLHRRFGIGWGAAGFAVGMHAAGRTFAGTPWMLAFVIAPAGALIVAGYLEVERTTPPDPHAVGKAIRDMAASTEDQARRSGRP